MPRRSFPIFLKSMYPTFQQFSRKDFNLTLFQMRKYYFCPCFQLKHSVFQSVISNNTQRQLQMQIQQRLPLTHTHTHTHTFNSPLSRTTRVSRYQRGKTNLDFTEARDSEWQWHQLDRMQVCTHLAPDR